VRNPATQPGAEKIPSLDGLRGFATLIVFVSHAANMKLAPAVLGHGFGQIGVLLFFVLSGFLMGHLYLRRPCDGANVRVFLLSRFARVMPLYWLVLLGSAAITTLWLPDFKFRIDTPRVFALHFFAIKGYWELWAIPVEIQFYLTFVLVWAFLRRAPSEGARWFRLFLLAVFLALLGAALWDWLRKMTFPAFSHLFLIGVALAQLRTTRIWLRLEAKLGAIPAWIAFVAFFLNLPEVRRITGTAAVVWGDPLSTCLVTGFFTFGLRGVGPFRLFETRALRFFGTISYAFYLFHGPVLKLAVTHARELGPLVLLTGSFVLVTGLALLSSRVFEEPIRRLLTGRPQRARAFVSQGT
jgi:peptidoglycan/LPS O-acetylase OafA/YrhL